MSKTIRITEQEIDLPIVEVLTGRLFLTGKSDSGKSNTISVVFEELLKQQYPFLVVDTEGEYYGLKEQFEVLHVGADEECDLQVGPEHAEKIAELALMQNVPIVLDVSGYIDNEVAEKLVEKVAEKLYNKEKKEKKPFLLFIEEGHEFVPEQGSAQKKANYDGCQGILTRIASRGRKRGLGIGLASQRPAKVDNDFITQCNWRGWHKLDWESDLKVVRKVLENNKPRAEVAEEEECPACGKTYELDQFDDRSDAECPACHTDPRNWRQVISSLEPGEAVLEADFLDFKAKEVKFKRKETFDAGATPTLEEFEKPELKGISEDLKEELNQISEQKKQEENEIEKLKEKIEKKDEEIERLEEALAMEEKNNENVERLADKIAQIGSSDEVPSGSEALEEIKEEKDQKISELQRQKEELEEKLEEKEERVNELEEYEEYKDIAEDFEEMKQDAEEAVIRLSEALDIETGGEVDEEAREKLKKRDTRIEELESELSELRQKKSVDQREERFQDAAEFLEDDLVNKYVGKAAENTEISETHFWDILTVIAQESGLTEEGVGSTDIEPLVDVSVSAVRQALKSMKTHEVVGMKKDGRMKLYYLDKEKVSEMKDLEEKRSRIKNRRKELDQNKE